MNMIFYGQIAVNLVISDYEDINAFLAKKPEQKALLSLTNDVHFHTVEANDEEILDKIEKLLQEMGNEK